MDRLTTPRLSASVVKSLYGEGNCSGDPPQVVGAERFTARLEVSLRPHGGTCQEPAGGWAVTIFHSIGVDTILFP